MKKTLGVIALATLFATSAHATVTTIEYTVGDQNVTIAYDDATMTASNAADGTAKPYTWDEASATVCREDDEQDLCVTFENPGTEAGHETPFTTNDGRSGTAKIVSVE